MLRFLKIGFIIWGTLVYSICYGQSLEILSEPLFHGSYYNVAASGDYAIFSAHGHLLSVSFADPASPEIVAIHRFDSGSSAAFLLGDYIYFAGGLEASAAIVDISNPADPQTVSTFNTYSNARDICARGNYAYVPDYFGQIIIANVVDPADPYVESRINTCDEAYSVALQGNYLYVGHQDSGLTVINIADAAHPFIAGRAVSDTSGRHSFTNLDISDNYAYVADYYSGLRIFDLSNPILPVCVSTILPDSNGIFDVIIDSSIAYCISPWHGLYIVDVSNPLSPSLAGDYWIENENPGSIAILGSRLFMLGREYYGRYSYVDLLDITDQIHPILLGSYHGCPFPPTYVALRGNYAFVGSNGMYSMDISDPSHPTKVGEFSGYVSHIVADDTTAYAFGNSSRLLILDISDPESLRVLGRDTLSWDPSDIAASRGYVYVSYGNSGFDIINVSIPEDPHNVRRYSNGTYVSSMIWQGDYLYTLAGLQIFNVSDPENPLLIGSCTPPYWPLDFCVEGNYAYLISWDASHHGGYLTVIDITDKANPAVVSSIETTGRPEGICAENNFVFMSEYENIIEVADVSNPYSPVLISRRDAFNPGSDMVIRDNILYLGGDQSFTIMQFHEPVAAQEPPLPVSESLNLECYPNPSNSSFMFNYTLSEASVIVLTIFDINGRLIKMVGDEYQAPGAHHIFWDCRDLASGIYFAKLSAGKMSGSSKIVLVR